MHYLLVAAVLAQVISLLYIIATSRPLASEGAWIVFRNLHQAQSSFGNNHFRYSASLWEVPSLFLAELSNYLGKDWTPIVVATWSLLIHIIPLAGLAVCYKILAQRRRQLALAFPLVSYGVATLPTIVYAANPLFEVHVYFWLILTTLISFDTKQAWSWIVFIFFLIPFSLSHELAMALVPFLIMGWISNKEIRSKPTVFWIIIAVLASSGLFSFYRSLAGNYTTQNDLLASVQSGYMFFVPQFLSCIAVSFFVFARSPASAKVVALWSSIITGAFLIYIAFFWNRALINIYMWSGRGLSIPIIGVLAIFFVISYNNYYSARLQRTCFLSLLIVLCALIVDLKLTHEWNLGKKNYFRIEGALPPGCHIISAELFRDKLAPYGFVDSQMPVVSFMLPQKRQIFKILYAAGGNNKYSPLPSDACEKTVRDRTYSFFGDQWLEPSRYFEFKFLKF
jgi:hypothetical protein